MGEDKPGDKTGAEHDFPTAWGEMISGNFVN